MANIKMPKKVLNRVIEVVVLDEFGFGGPTWGLLVRSKPFYTAKGLGMFVHHDSESFHWQINGRGARSVSTTKMN